MSDIVDNNYENMTDYGADYLSLSEDDIYQNQQKGNKKKHNKQVHKLTCIRKRKNYKWVSELINRLDGKNQLAPLAVVIVTKKRPIEDYS